MGREWTEVESCPRQGFVWPSKQGAVNWGGNISGCYLGALGDGEQGQASLESFSLETLPKMERPSSIRKEIL